MMTPIAMSCRAQQWEQGKAVHAFAGGRHIIADLPAAGWALFYAMPLTLSPRAPVLEMPRSGWWAVPG